MILKQHSPLLDSNKIACPSNQVVLNLIFLSNLSIFRVENQIPTYFELGKYQVQVENLKKSNANAFSKFFKCLKYVPSTTPYSEVLNRRTSLLRLFRFSFHRARNFSCNKQKIPPCSFINLLSKKADRVEFLSNPARLFRSALL